MSLARYIDRVRARRLRRQADELRERGFVLIAKVRRLKARANAKDAKATEIEKRGEEQT